MRRPGKKVRIEQFKLKNSMVEDVELRLTDKGEFYMEVDGTAYKAKTLEDLRTEVLAVLNQSRTLTYRPVIRVGYDSADDDVRGRHWENGYEVDRAQVRLNFMAGWVSETSAEADREVFRWIRVEAEEDALELPAPDTTSDWRTIDRVRKDDVAEMIPFTPERWRTLRRIHAGIIELRKRIAAVMADASGAKLDAIPPGPLMLETPKPRKKS